MKAIVVIIASIVFYCSCSQSNIIKSVPVSLVRPEHVQTLDIDPNFDSDFPECRYCTDIGITNDTILLLQDHTTDLESETFYKAYSLTDYSYLGDALMKGRGPDEALYPIYNGDFISHKTGKVYCHIYDSMLGQTFLLDIEGTLKEGRTRLQPLSMLKGDVMYVYPYLDSLQYLSDIEGDRIYSHIIDKDGRKLKSIILYEDVPARQNISRICCYNTINPEDGRVAMLMRSLPQLNILDFRTSGISSAAVAKAYRKWRDIVFVKNFGSAANSIVYYRGAISTAEYIIGLYDGQPNSDKTKTDLHIHIFDWDCNFLYDLSVEEHLNWITYDKRTGYLYGLDKAAGEIYRYDLSEILQEE